MLPVNCGTHADYQRFVMQQLRKYYPDPDKLPLSTWDIIERFWLLDLTFTDEYMRNKYSVFGPKPRTPSCMQRSYLLSIDFKITSLTEWAAQLKINPLYAILSGFEFGDTPGVGTFYDFLSRLWDSDQDNLSPHLRKLKTRVKKPARQGDKAESTEKTTVRQLMNQLKKEHFSISEQPYQSLFKIYTEEFLNQSVAKGLIDPSYLSIAGDGTPVVTSARERRHRICNCEENGISNCDCSRYFSQPDCDIGWDSSRNCYYHGYDLYMMVAANSKSDLPVFPLLHPASMHDSLGFLHTFFRMKAFLPDFHTRKLLLDSAHDAMSYYNYCRENGIVPFIDIKKKGETIDNYKGEFSIGPDGVPVCRAGLRMRCNGTERAKGRAKYRCPLHFKGKGCSCENPCTDSAYGRVIHLAVKNNPRLFNIPPRNSREWKTEYNSRTSAERSNKRQKIDFKLESGRHRSTKMWYCRLYHILMLQHLDAWDLPRESALRKLIAM